MLTPTCYLSSPRNMEISMLHIASLKVPLRRRVLLRAAMEKVVSRTKKSSDGGRIWRTYWLAGTEQKELVPSELISDSAALGETNYTSTCAIKDAERNTITVDVVHPRTTILGGLWNTHLCLTQAIGSMLLKYQMIHQEIVRFTKSETQKLYKSTPRSNFNV